MNFLVIIIINACCLLLSCLQNLDKLLLIGLLLYCLSFIIEVACICLCTIVYVQVIVDMIDAQ
jgi:hypothetical protein